MRFLLLSTCLVVLVAASVNSCGGGSQSSSELGQGKATIGPEGGTVTSRDGKASVTIPPGALSKEENITITPVDDFLPGALEKPYEFGPDRLTFKLPVTIQLHYQSEMLPEGLSDFALQIGRFRGGAWILADKVQVDPIKGVISAHSSSFSSYATIAAFPVLIDGGQQVPPVDTPASGNGLIIVDTVSNQVRYRIEYGDLSGSEVAAYIYGFAGKGETGDVLIGLPVGTPKVGAWQYPEDRETEILKGLTYVGIHSTVFPGGEIRGQINAPDAAPKLDNLSPPGGPSGTLVIIQGEDFYETSQVRVGDFGFAPIVYRKPDEIAFLIPFENQNNQQIALDEATVSILVNDSLPIEFDITAPIEPPVAPGELFDHLTTVAQNELPGLINEINNVLSQQQSIEIDPEVKAALSNLQIYMTNARVWLQDEFPKVREDLSPAEIALLEQVLYANGVSIEDIVVNQPEPANGAFRIGLRTVGDQFLDNRRLIVAMIKAIHTLTTALNLLVCPVSGGSGCLATAAIMETLGAILNMKSDLEGAIKSFNFDVTNISEPHGFIFQDATSLKTRITPDGSMQFAASITLQQQINLFDLVNGVTGTLRKTRSLIEKELTKKLGKELKDRLKKAKDFLEGLDDLQIIDLGGDITFGPENALDLSPSLLQIDCLAINSSPSSPETDSCFNSTPFIDKATGVFQVLSPTFPIDIHFRLSVDNYALYDEPSGVPVYLGLHYPVKVDFLGDGSVELPGEFICRSYCEELPEVPRGTLFAKPDEGNVFELWLDCPGEVRINHENGEGECDLPEVAVDNVVTAIFREILPVNVTINGYGRVYSEPSGIDCPEICNTKFAPFSSGTNPSGPEDSITLYAVSFSNSKFEKWGDSGCPGVTSMDGTNGVCHLPDASKGASVTTDFSLNCPASIGSTNWTLIAAGSREPREDQNDFCGPIPPSACIAPNFCDQGGCVKATSGTVTFSTNETGNSNLVTDPTEYSYSRPFTYSYDFARCIVSLDFEDPLVHPQGWRVTQDTINNSESYVLHAISGGGTALWYASPVSN